MKAVCIVVKDNKISESGYNKLVETSKQVGNEFDILKWNAITHETVDNFMLNANIKWNYPWKGSEQDRSDSFWNLSQRTFHS